MIDQVLMNLCVNARDAMPEGGRLTVRTRRAAVEPEAAARNPEARPGVFASLSVEDSGCGMDQETLRRIFEPFFTTKGVGKGTGLGLATVYGIVKQHGGWIEVMSAPGQGSRFEVFLPVEDPAPAPVADAGAVAVARGGRETILVVEDEEPLRRLVERILRHYDYQVHTAGTGKEAMGVWRERFGRFDLLFTDMVMPDGISGRELARRLRREAPGLKVLFTSGYSSELVAGEASWGAEFNFLPKPFSPARLVAAVRNAIEKPVESPPAAPAAPAPLS